MAQPNEMDPMNSSSKICDHPLTTSTVTAGLERLVCDECAHVSLRYQDEGAFWPNDPMVETAPREEDRTDTVVDLTDTPETKQHRCTACELPAVFMTPYGVACNKHAWIAASKQDSMDSDFWSPILIDRPDGARPIHE